MSSKAYQLRSSVQGHSKDAKFCVTTGELSGVECIVSCSRGNAAKPWVSEGTGYHYHQTFGGSDVQVSSVAIAKPTESQPLGQVIAGCQDGSIRIYNPRTTELVSTLFRHTCSVGTLVARGGFIMSGSLDKTAKIWKYGDTTPLLTLSGHLGPIFAVEMLLYSSAEALYLTGSADTTIKLWKGDSLLQLFEGHKDCVRALAVVDKRRFLSASNDATIRLWKTSGECLATYYGHLNSIYGLEMMPGTTDFVSCGKDGTVRLWKLEEPDDCQQTILLPSLSVWSVAVMKNHDIVTGSSDGHVSVLTNSVDQMPLGNPGPHLLLYNSELPSMRPGKTLHEGKEYDFVVDVALDDDDPHLKFPFNLSDSENPMKAAKRFLRANHLNVNPRNLLTMINFILTKTERAKKAAVPSSAPLPTSR